MVPRLTACPVCQLSSLLSPVRPRITPPPWHSTGSRSASQLQRKRPSRMTLSPSVRKPSNASRAQKDKPRRREVDGPFAATNRTTPGLRFEADRRRMQDRLQSSARSHPLPAAKPVTRARKTAERPAGDMKALKMQSALSHIGYGQRASVKTKIQDLDSFSEFPLLPVLQESIPSQALRGMVDISPTPIQRLAIPALLRGVDANTKGHSASAMQQFLLAAETGSGKTLAYLLPTIDAIKRADMAAAEVETSENEVVNERNKKNQFELEPPPLSNEPHPTSGRPRAVILVPTAELVDQVGALFKAFSHTVKLRVSLISAAYTANVIRKRLFGPGGIDVVVSTPHLLKSISESEPNILSRVTHLIIDEADSLLDRSFAPLTTGILDRATPSLKQLILCSATIPRSLDSFLEKRFPNMQRLATPNLHAIPRRVQLSVVDIDREPYRGNRDLACADTIWQIGRAAASSEHENAADAKRVIVFVNEREKAAELAGYLATKGVDAVALNRDTVEQRKGEILAAFTAASTALPLAKDAAGNNNNTTFANDQEASPSTSPAGAETMTPARKEAPRVLSNVKVLVMTDIGSRGIDTLAVRNVVLYDVPHTSVDFIHRLGRVGRMGRRGRGTVLVGKHDRKDVVREVREGMFRGQALI